MTHVRGAVAHTASVAGDTIAVQSSAAAITYRTLDELAGRVTGFLRANDIGEGSRVVVHMTRGLDLFPVLLGILGAGAAFVPVDAATPVDRMTRIVTNCAPALIVNNGALRRDWCDSGVRVVSAADMTRCGISPALPEADRAAYVLYTSGTTGDPKGVVVGSNAMHRYLDWARTEYQMDAGTGAPLFTSIAFDATLTTLFGPLLAGRAITVLSDDQPVLELAETLRHSPDFSFVKATPHHVRLLAELLHGERLDTAMRFLVVGGDELDTATVRRWTAVCPVPVVNEYGPTETVVGCSAFTVLPHEVGVLGATVPIGRAVAGARLHVLDADGEPVAPGDIGELFIGGPSADNHYLAQPALTAAKFVPDPFGAPGARMYRTGDLAAVRPDGVLEFHGRGDRQVKVRGVRVELGEIEAAVRSVPGVVDAAAFSTRVGAEVATVMAYTGAVTPEVIRDDLTDRVPTWVVPNRIVQVDVLPTTANAKADLAALADLLPFEEATPLEHAPTDPLIATLIAEFGAVLPSATVAAESDFYRCGGDSMAGIRLVARLRRLGLDASPADVPAYPTPTALASLLATRASTSSLLPETEVGREIDLTPAQRDFFSLGLVNPGHWNQNVVFAAPDGIDRDRILAAVTDVAAGRDVLSYRYRDGRQVHVGGPPAVEFQAVTVPDRTSLDHAIRDANTGLSLVDGPLARVVHISVHGQPDHLALVAHHLVVDEVSWHVFIDDLANAYRTESTSRIAASAGGFAHWRSELADFAKHPKVLDRRRYWDGVLAAPTGDLVHEGDPTDDYAGERYLRDGLDAATTTRLRAAAESSRIGVHEILLGAVVASVCGVFAIAPPRVDVESHGRADLGNGYDASRVMGWCTAIFPVVLTGSSTTDLCRSARDVLGALPWHGMEFGLLRSEETTPSRSSQILFNYLGERDRVLDHRLGWSLVDPPPGAQSPPSGRRPYPLEFQSRLIDGEISWEWRYGSLHSVDTLQALSDRLRRTLAGVADELASDPSSRFADSGLSDDELATVLAQYSESDEPMSP